MPYTIHKTKITLAVDDDGNAWECHFENESLEEDVGEIVVIIGWDLDEVFGRGINQ